MHGLHWLIVSLSIGLTFGAWYISSSQVEAKRLDQFERESQRVIELVDERMRKYEDALWGGVALIDTLDGDLSAADWHRYSKSLRIEEKYVGISGIGVIYALQMCDMPAFLANQTEERPDFRVHPQHELPEFFPITYIEPAENNAPAVGLDMAFESNRYSAAKRARDSGLAQITGPIILISDEGNTPGFLLYAPFYADASQPQAADRREEFSGMVYAPFVFKSLMDGVLAKESRHVGLRITDKSEVLYDEHEPSQAEYDPNPLYTKKSTLVLFGRVWDFDIRSSHSFRDAQRSAQPLTILIGGILINTLLIGMFVVISRANRRALSYADEATAELKLKASDLEGSNRELERFAYVASHDLQEPLRTVCSFSELLAMNYRDSFDSQGQRWLKFMSEGAKRMQSLVQGLLEYSRIGNENAAPTLVDTNALLHEVLGNLQGAIDESNAIVTFDALPAVMGIDSQLRIVFQNLIANALKFQAPETQPKVHIGAEVEGDDCVFCVSDNGIGIEPESSERIFQIFQRLHTSDEYPGTGIGLGITKKVVEAHGGGIWLESSPGEGTKFFFSLAKASELDVLGAPFGQRSQPRELRKRRVI